MCTKLTRQIEKYLIIGDNRLSGYNISTGNLVREGDRLCIADRSEVSGPSHQPIKPYHQYNAPDSVAS